VLVCKLSIPANKIPILYGMNIQVRNISLVWTNVRLSWTNVENGKGLFFLMRKNMGVKSLMLFRGQKSLKTNWHHLQALIDIHPLPEEGRNTRMSTSTNQET
jgi:hypothetical protein